MKWLKDKVTGQVRSNNEWQIVAPDKEMSSYDEVCEMDGKWFILEKDIIPYMDEDLAVETQNAVGNASDQEFLDWYRSIYYAKHGKIFSIAGELGA